MDQGPTHRLLYLHRGENEPTLQGTPDYTKPLSEGGDQAEKKTVAAVMADVAEKLGIAFHSVPSEEMARVKSSFLDLGDKIFLAHSGQTQEDGIWVAIDSDDGRKLIYTMIRNEEDLRTITTELGFFEPVDRWPDDGR